MSAPILTCAETTAFEKEFFAGDTAREAAFMARAGAGIAAETEKLFAEISGDPIRSILVLAGKGHNAADALIAAFHLRKKHSADVKILFARPPENLVPATREALEKLLRTGADIIEKISDTGDTDVLLDGLLGYNFCAPLRAEFLALIQAANAAAEKFKLRVAVDLPSGMSDAGEPPENILHADATIACGILKKPLLDEKNTALAGRLRFIDIGFPATKTPLLAGGKNLIPATLKKLRAPHSDKRDFGHLFILGGSRTMPGALLMNVRAALKTGVGLVTAFCPESVHAAFAAAAPEAMWIPWPETPAGDLALEGEHLLREKISRADALLCGSGMTPAGETRALLQSIVGRIDCPLILDAGALCNEVLDTAKNRKTPAPLVLLPHAGEFARIAGERKNLREVAGYFRAHIALKGAPTRVANAEREIAVCTGGPILARGGSGDLLAGITGALFAKNVGGNALETLAGAVAWHGAAGDLIASRCGAEAVTTLEILDGLADALRV